MANPTRSLVATLVVLAFVIGTAAPADATSIDPYFSDTIVGPAPVTLTFPLYGGTNPVELRFTVDITNTSSTTWVYDVSSCETYNDILARVWATSTSGKPWSGPLGSAGDDMSIVDAGPVAPGQTVTKTVVASVSNAVPKAGTYILTVDLGRTTCALGTTTAQVFTNTPFGPFGNATPTVAYITVTRVPHK